MCGIALILSGVRLGSATACPNPPRLRISIEDLKSALHRRGPDSIGSKKVFFQIQTSNDANNPSIITFLEDKALCGTDTPSFAGELYFIGATLQLRGVSPIVQPLVDRFGNMLAYNGEIFGGIDIDSSSNDGMVLLEHLARCCSCDVDGHACSCSSYQKDQLSVIDVLSKIKGPWAMVYWQNSSKTLWFGRDAFGRRSLLVHWPSEEDPRFLLSSVSSVSSVEPHSAADCDLENGVSQLAFWEELPCGIYSIAVDTYADNHLYSELKKHDWRSSMVKDLVRWERILVEPGAEGSDICVVQPTSSVMHTESGIPSASNLEVVQVVLNTLKESVLRRTAHHLFFEAGVPHEQRQLAPVAVLFSGGLDSMIIAALLDQCLDPQYEVDLLNVSFDGSSAPDRISGRSGLKELRKISPARRWRLVEIDADLSSLTLEMKHVMSLIHPANTYMDLNIGMALWLASSGNGWVYEGSDCDDYKDMQRHKYKSYSRIVLVGSGADEQCAGYGRHKTKFKCGSWIGLDEEMRLDMQRIWKRNLGRDDRCIADCGKEARFPFLDEDVIRTLLDIPLWKIADLEQQSGIGDKKILREVARLLGLNEASSLPKRAIQFGSRIARESNRKNFGSNRAANLASAGSVTIGLT